ncbi:hypothetical protein GCM10010365_57410 [Streptomyces poonensis]|uniref:Uncharacterized protein n=1 Tax=Streptomyces poonensis TaxID=68255 RepID=A0A918Q348_9ACTN|nr:hypothetical protein GCM10010365_57410 [Streptomyces poonensis]
MVLSMPGCWSRRVPTASTAPPHTPDPRAATKGYGQPGTNWSEDRPLRSWMWQNTWVGAGGGVRAEPVADVDRHRQAPVGGLRHGKAGENLPQPGHIDVPAVQRVVHGAVPAPVLDHQCQVHRSRDRPVRAQQCVHRSEQFVPARGQTAEQVVAEAGGGR